MHAYLCVFQKFPPNSNFEWKDKNTRKILRKAENITLNLLDRFNNYKLRWLFKKEPKGYLYFGLINNITICNVYIEDERLKK